MYFDSSYARVWGRSHEHIPFQIKGNIKDLESVHNASKASGRLRGSELEDVVHFLRRDLLLRQLSFRDVTNF
jgi:hypothetical protein